jgi:hypothetical protein
MITGERIIEISGKKESLENIAGLSINITLDNVTVKGEAVELTYEYTANYEDKVGLLKIKGIITAKEDKKLAKEIDERWKKEKKLPDKYAELLLGAINYSGSANGTLIARVLGLTAPLIPPHIQLSRAEESKK